MTPLVELRRIKSNNEGTLGMVHGPENFWCFCIELPWRNNARSISCIPEGTYLVTWTWSKTFGREMYLIKNVINRSGIRIHPGNWAGDKNSGFRTDSYGCPMFGHGYRHDVGHQMMITDSAKAVKDFEDLLEKKDFYLRIEDPAGGF